ncbi:MAG: 4-oxalomesaconate tautomerase [Pseudomonadota bacterium]
MSDGIPALWMRGGSSKGGYFLARDLPDDPGTRDALLLAIMGSPDPRQIDGLGGASPLTSKVAVVGPSEQPGCDVDYLFLQVFVDEARVSDAQPCGNILAGVGPFAIERGLVEAKLGETEVRIRNLNTGQSVRAIVQTPQGRVRYDGDAVIDGVPGSSAPIPLFFSGIAGSTCGALLPTGRTVDRVEGVEATLIDGGMPAVILRAGDLGIDGTEPPETLEADLALKSRVEGLRRAAGPMMALGDVTESSVPKMVLVSPPRAGGLVHTRCFIPHRVHQSIGVLCAVSIATACLLPDGPAAEMSGTAPDGAQIEVTVEHPAGALPLILRRDADGTVIEAGNLRTARKLFDGLVFPKLT